MTKNNVGFSVGIKVFVAITGLVFAVSSVASLVIYRQANDDLLFQVRGRLAQVAANAALQIDPVLHQKIVKKGDEESQQFKHILYALDRVAKANRNIKGIYTMRPTNVRNKWAFVVDCDLNKETRAPVGELYDISDCPMLKAALNEPTADQTVISDKWGDWISGYAPIRDKRGHVDGIIGLDMSAAELSNQCNALKMAAVRNIVVSLIVAMGLSLLVTMSVLKRIRVFTEAAKRLAAGDMDFSLRDLGRDEIGQFAGKFNEMIVRLRESRDQILEASSHDMLTGVYNHMYFHDQLTQEIERAQRYAHPLAVLILDLDRFKSINDNLGHAVGDSLVRQLATLIKENLRNIDIVCRYGGDEFSAILPETTCEAATIVAEHLRRIVESHKFIAIPISELVGEGQRVGDEKTVTLTVTIGVSSYPEAHLTKDGLFMAADIALCRAKHTSRNSVCAYDPATDAKGNVDPQDLYKALHDPNTMAVTSLAAAVDAKDQYTHGHSERVAQFAVDLGDALGFSDEQQEALKVAGLLHDLGKIGVPDSILNKPGSLTTDERQAINQHPSLGANILKRAPQLDQIMPAVIFHHERWDGTGYPNGLKGEEIPMIARVMAVADSFDAMTSNRSYRKAMSVEEAIVELRTGAGTQFDPNIVEAFIGKVENHVQKAA